MLEHFKVPTDDQVLVAEESLHRTVTEFFVKMGETPEDANIAADTLVNADLRGVERHGVANMLKRSLHMLIGRLYVKNREQRILMQIEV